MPEIPVPSTLQYKLWIPAFTDVHSDTHPMLKYLSLSCSSWKSAIFTRQLNSVQDTSLLLQVTRVIAVAVLNHLWNFSPNLWKVMKEGKKKKHKLKNWKEEQTVFQKNTHLQTNHLSSTLILTYLHITQICLCT